LKLCGRSLTAAATVSMMLISASELPIIRSPPLVISLPESTTSEQPTSYIICDCVPFASHRNLENQGNLWCKPAAIGYNDEVKSPLCTSSGPPRHVVGPTDEREPGSAQSRRVRRHLERA